MDQTIDVFKKYNIDAENELIKTSLTKNGKTPDVQNYERLEFLGDRIVGYIVCKYLYTNTDLNENKIANILEKCTCNKTNYKFSKMLRIR